MKKIIPPYLKNFYVVSLIIFVIWMTFFDSNDWINRFRMSYKLRNLKNEKEYYHEKIKEVEKDKKELMGNDGLLEKFAREKYLMKKPGEDIFIIKEKD
ncbi:MAG: FtsB family cell division protein [Cyclobacteriaceae bacterium]